MNINQLNSLKVLKAVADTGSFSQAAKILGLSTARVSKSLNNLEQSIGVTLFHRNTRKVQLTKAGALCYRRGEAILHSWDDLVDEISDEEKQPKGEIKICAPMSWGIELLSDLLIEFQHANPQVSFHLDLEDKYINIGESDYDIVFRLSETLENSNLIAKRLTRYKLILCCSHNYVEEYTRPYRLSDLNEHLLITYEQTNSIQKPWTFKKDNKTLSFTPIHSVKSNNSLLLKQFLMSHKGIAYIPSFLVENELENGDVISLLNDLRTEELPLYLLRHNSPYLPQRLRSFIDFLSEKFSQQ